MRVQILRPSDNWEALYVDGELRLEGHGLDVDYVVQALTGEFPDIVDVGDYTEDDEDVEFDVEEDGKRVDKIEGVVVWINGEGCPQQWPFSDEQRGYQNPDGN